MVGDPAAADGATFTAEVYRESVCRGCGRGRVPDLLEKL